MGGCGGCDGGRVHGSHVFAHLVVVALGLVIAGLRDLRRGCRACELLGWSDGNLCWLDVLQVVELALTDLLADDVNVAREVDLLDGFGEESRQQAQDDCNQADCPER